jgi:hypothetical protein
MNPEITWLLESTFVYDEVRQLTRDNPQVAVSPDLFARWYSYHYAHSATMGVRRMIDRGSKSSSLERLLRDILKHRASVTRAWHSTLYHANQDDQDAAELTFSNIAGKGQGVLPASVVHRDLARLAHCRTTLAVC